MMRLGPRPSLVIARVCGIVHSETRFVIISLSSVANYLPFCIDDTSTLIYYRTLSCSFQARRSGESESVPAHTRHMITGDIYADHW